MGKYVLLVVASSVLASLIITRGGIESSSSSSGAMIYDHTARIVASEIAHSGANEAIQLVALDYELNGSYGGATQITGSLQGGTYAVQIDDGGAADVTIKSVGVYMEERVTVLRNYTVGTTGVEPPDFMKGAMTARGNISVSDDLVVESEDSTVNANIRTNNNLTFSGKGTANVSGFGLYSWNASSTMDQALGEIFAPNSNPGGLPSVQKVDPVEMPDFDPSEYSSIATKVSTKALNLSGHYTLGTYDNPVIWHVQGALSTAGAVSFSGYGVFIVDGSIEISHHITSDAAASESTLGFYTAGSVDIRKGSLELAGQLYANDNIRLAANTTIKGSMTADNIAIGGDLNIIYREASSALTRPFWTSDGGVQLANQQIWYAN